MNNSKPVPGKDGNRYVPFEERTGESAVVFYTRDLSEEGLKKIYDRVSSVLSGKRFSSRASERELRDWIAGLGL